MSDFTVEDILTQIAKLPPPEQIRLRHLLAQQPQEPPSTTVVLMKLCAVCKANIWRSLDASGARSTRPECAPFSVAWRAQGARRDDECRSHSAPLQPSRSLECRQAARVEVGQC